jgi:hypothetical protein
MLSLGLICFKGLVLSLSLLGALLLSFEVGFLLAMFISLLYFIPLNGKLYKTTGKALKISGKEYLKHHETITCTPGSTLGA